MEIAVWQAISRSDQDKMAAIFAGSIFKCTVLNEDIWFLIKIHLSLLLRFQSTINQHWFRWSDGLAPSRHQAITWTNDGLFHLRMYASASMT